MTSQLKVPVELLRCPITGEALRWSNGTLLTQDTGRCYPVSQGVPILLDKTLSVVSQDHILANTFAASHGTFLRKLRQRWIPGRTLSIGTSQRYDRMRYELHRVAQSRRPIVLVVGGGVLGEGMSVLAESSDVDLVETDVYLTPRVSVVCDGHDLPFASGAFDGVVVQAVLEHVLDPAKVVSEIHRVLRPNGLVYAETPFMQAVHAGRYDFTRWTETGHRRLFRMFTEIDRGICAGPGTALLWSLCYFARSLPRKQSVLPAILDSLTVLGFFWLKYLDRVLIGHPGASDTAAGVFFMGRKADRPIPDTEVLDGYRGTVGLRRNVNAS